MFGAGFLGMGTRMHDHVSTVHVRHAVEVIAADEKLGCLCRLRRGPRAWMGVSLAQEERVSARKMWLH